MTDAPDIARRTAARLRERFNAGETLIYSAAELLESLAAQLKALDEVSSTINDGMRVVIEARNVTIATLRGAISELQQVANERDSTIADLRELLEFKRKELATLSREVQRLRAVDGPAK